MSTRDIPAPKSNLLPVLLVPIVLCLAGAAALTVLTRSPSPVAAPADQLSFVMQRVPFEAQNALRGDTSAFDALGRSADRLKSLHGSVADPKVAADGAWASLGD